MSYGKETTAFLIEETISIDVLVICISGISGDNIKINLTIILT